MPWYTDQPDPYYPQYIWHKKVKMTVDYLGNQRYTIDSGHLTLTFQVGGRNRVFVVLPDGAVSGASKAFAYFERIFKPGRLGWFLTSEGAYMCGNAVRHKGR